MAASQPILRERQRAAVIAAHPDDEVLGCGATIARLASVGVEVHILLLADGETSRGRSPEAGAVAARAGAAEAARAALGARSVELLGLPDNRMDSLELLDVVRPVEEFIYRHSPAMVLTHHAGDVNIDHRITHEAVAVACRPQPGHPVRRLLFFEVPSSTEWRPDQVGYAFTPNWFEDATATLDLKLAALQAYAPELRKFPHPRSAEAITALARWRGASVGLAAAEAFMVGRVIRNGLD